MQSRVVFGTFVFLAILVALYDAFAFYHGHLLSHSFELAWSLVSALLLLFWLLIDSKDRSEIYRPFEYGFLVLVFWFPYFPYYLVRTRHIRGVFWLAGILGLFYLGYMFEWVIYAVR